MEKIKFENKAIVEQQKIIILNSKLKKANNRKLVASQINERLQNKVCNQIQKSLEMEQKNKNRKNKRKEKRQKAKFYKLLNVNAL